MENIMNLNLLNQNFKEKDFNVLEEMEFKLLQN